MDSSTDDLKKPENARGNSSAGIAFVVDDEPDLVDIIREELEEVGFQVHGFSDAREALSELVNLKPTVVLTDVNMPGIDGYELQRRLRELEPELPIIFVTGKATKEGIIQAVALGLDNVIEKPFDSYVLCSTAMNASRRYQLTKLLDRTINVVINQYFRIYDFLKEAGREKEQNHLKTEIMSLKALRRAMVDAQAMAQAPVDEAPHNVHDN